MKIPILALAFICMSTGAFAKIPFHELERLRQITVVLHAAMDKPDSEQVRACKEPLDADTLGARLADAHDKAALSWKKTPLTAQDVKLLMVKAQDCSPRASCLVYETYVNAAKATKPATKRIDGLKQALDQQVKAMSGETYQSAWKTIKNPCLILRTQKQAAN